MPVIPENLALQRPGIYLDYHATTPVDPRVVDIIARFLSTSFGNASSVGHDFGDEAEEAVSRARESVAALVGASARDVIFTSGTTESVNLVLQGKARRKKSPLRIGLTRIEHPSVRETAVALEKRGEATCRWFTVNAEGSIDLESFEDECAKGLDLACVILAHNEIGTIQSGSRLAEIARRWGVEILFDATQAAGRIAIDAEGWGADYITLSAHKMYGPKGIGALVKRHEAEISPLMFGGSQERGLRPGTLAVPLIAGFGEAARLRTTEMGVDESRIGQLRNKLQSSITHDLSDVEVNGNLSSRLAGNLHVSIAGVANTDLQARLRHRVAFSTGSACASGSGAPSFVLRQLGWDESRVRGAVRFGLGKFTSLDDVLTVGELVVAEAKTLRGYNETKPLSSIHSHQSGW